MAKATSGIQAIGNKREMTGTKGCLHQEVRRCENWLACTSSTLASKHIPQIQISGIHLAVHVRRCQEQEEWSNKQSG
jgi:hypothetical protein